MSDEAEALAGIRANAEMVVEKLGTSSGLDNFGFDARSVEWVDGFIERQRVREDVGPEFVGRMVNVLGSYLGESIIRTYGGRWSFGEYGWCVEFDARNAAYPFAKVQKQFSNGSGDSIYSFFSAIPILFPALRPAGPRNNQSPQRIGGAHWFSGIRKWFGRGPGR
ncbi:hypothetical protein ACMHYB_33560 [Sorangium sp. So ce1128]